MHFTLHTEIPRPPGRAGSFNAGFYVHVPFCRRKCSYCGFYSISALSLIPAWLDGFRKETLLYKDQFGPFDSLYLGGGTPSLLDAQGLDALLSQVFRHFTFCADVEITIEANPEDLNPDKVALLRDLGINRISLGVQSFNDEELRCLGRRHTADKTERVLELIRSSGFNNLGVDLIYGFWGQSEDSWLETMRRVLAFRPEHLSCYQMTVEEGTVFGKMLTEGRIKPLDEEKENSLFLLTSRFLEDQGYIHYEISNFALDSRFYCRHNQKYWRRQPYLGLGPSAHSFGDGMRWWNLRSVCSYCQILQNGKAPVGGTEILTAEQVRLESLYLGFRTRDGVDIKTLHLSPHSDRTLSQLQESGLVEVTNNRVLPTRKGFAVADCLPLLFANQV